LAYVGCQHDGRLLGGSKSHDPDVPGVRCHGVSDVAHNLAWEALLAVGIDNGKGDGVFGVRHNGEVTVVPAIWTAVQSVVVVVLVGQNMERLAINVECRVLDAIGVPTRYTAKVGVDLAFVCGRVVKAEDNVALHAILAGDEEVGNGGAVRNKVTTNALGRDLVLAVLVRPSSPGRVWRSAVLGKGSRRKERQDGGEPHRD